VIDQEKQLSVCCLFLWTCHNFVEGFFLQVMQTTVVVLMTVNFNELNNDFRNKFTQFASVVLDQEDSSINGKPY